MPLVRCAALLALFAALVSARGVRVEFDPRSPAIGPFPTDFLTIPDTQQLTNLRVNLPLPDCNVRPTDCRELGLVNTLDGFHRNARITVRFSAAVRPDTLRAGIFFVWLDAAYPQPFLLKPPLSRTPINQVVWNPATNSAHAKPDEAFDQGRRYAIVVTDEVKDAAGDPVERDEGFEACLSRQIGGDYCVALSDAVQRLTPAVAPARIVSASIFTTMTSTAMLEQVPALLEQTPLSFRRVRGPVRAAGLRGIVLRRDTGGPGALVDERIPLTPELLALSNIGSVAFGSFRSPRFLNAEQMIPPAPTRARLPVPAESEEIAFHVWLPRTPPPPGGYGVILAGHGLGDSRFGFPTAAAFGMTAGNFAIVAMSAVGHGGGPRSELIVEHADGNITIEAPGRGSVEQCLLAVPGAPVLLRDCVRQTAADYMQLVRQIRAGMDLDGDGRPDLSTDRIFYVGQSLGSYYGAALLAAERGIPAGVLNVGPGNSAEASVLSPVFQPLVGLLLGLRIPPLLNAGLGFNAEYPLRYEPVKILSVTGSAAIQEVLDRIEWIESPGSAYSYAPHLKSATLAGVGVKRILLQLAWGDQTVPNPSSSQLVRGANLRENTSLYRHDRARGVVPGLPANPHAFLAGFAPPEYALIAVAAQEQAVRFLLSGTEQVPDVNPLVRPLFGVDLFEVPENLPEQLNFLR